MGFLPAKAKKPFFIPLTYQEISAFFDKKRDTTTETTETTSAPAIGIRQKRQALKEFLASSNAKICFDAQQCLKIVFCLFPTTVGK